MRKIEGFKRKERGVTDAGKLEPARDAGIAPQDEPGREPRLTKGGQLRLRHDAMK